MFRENKSVSGCGLAKDEASASRIIQNILLQPKSPNGFKYDVSLSYSVKMTKLS